MESFTELMSYDTLTTFTGCTAATAFITALTKDCVDKLPKHIPTRILSFVIAFVVLNVGYLGIGTWTVINLPLIFFNSIAVSFVSNSAFDSWRQFIKATRKSNNKEEEL